MASTDVATSTPKPVAAHQGMTADQVDLIRRTLAAKATDDELALFISLADRTGLDPFTRQIFLVPRKQKIDDRWVETHQAMVSIDGARLVAQRSGKYRGQTPPEWCGDDGVWREAWLDQVDPPAAARVGVYHADYPERATFAVARYRSYVQTVRDGAPNATWHRMPDVMLAKCAEMLALRKAFQQDLSGLIIEEEAGNDPVLIVAGEGMPPSEVPLPATLITREERNALDAARKAAGLTVSEVKAILVRVADVTNSQQLKSSQLQDVLDAIEAAGLDDVVDVSGGPDFIGNLGEEPEVVRDAETLL